MTAHPSKFSSTVLDAIQEVARSRIPKGTSVLDPFAGSGLIHKLGRDMGWKTIGVEIELEWAAMAPGTLQADATRLPFRSGAFEAVVVSPVYGNRMSDSHDAVERCKPCKGTGLILGIAHYTIPPICEKCHGTGRRVYRRNTYKHVLGRTDQSGKVLDLHPRNTGQMQWGKDYREMHVFAWAEATRVATDWFVLSISDHYRRGELVPVTQWHVDTLCRFGWEVIDWEKVDTPRNRHGANRDLRAAYESVILLAKSR